MTSHYQMGYDEGSLAAREGAPPTPGEAENFPTDLLSGEREAFLAGYEQGYQDITLDLEQVRKHSCGHGRERAIEYRELSLIGS